MTGAVRSFALHPAVRYVAGPGLMAVGAFVEPVAVAAAIVALGAALIGLSNWAADAALRQEDARRALMTLLQSAVMLFEAARPSAAARTLRANIMLFDAERGALRIAYRTSGYTEGETRLMWRPGEGCAGRAWERETTVFAPEDAELPVKVDDARAPSRPWNMTEDQIRMTAETVQSVISSPIFAPDGRAVGVFNLDDSTGLDESKLGDADIQAAVEEIAESIGELLLRTRLEFPPEAADA